MVHTVEVDDMPACLGFCLMTIHYSTLIQYAILLFCLSSAGGCRMWQKSWHSTQDMSPHCKRSDLCISRNETARPRSQFLHSCICERFMYYRINLPILLQPNRHTVAGVSTVVVHTVAGVLASWCCSMMSLVLLVLPVPGAGPFLLPLWYNYSGTWSENFYIPPCRSLQDYWRYF